jgi:MerR family transcriptional regulator, light-induced transcriptional regulator
MKTQIKYFNSEDAAKILGVNVSTIKRWTEGGELECIKTAGGHRKFLMSHLADFVERNKKKSSKISLFPLENEHDIEVGYYVLKGDFHFLNRYVLDQAMLSNREQVQQVFNGLYMGQFPLHQIYDLLITPVLHQIGFLWEEGKISVVEEHIASQTIRDGIMRLQGIIRIPTEKIGKVLCVTPSKELHDIPLKMVDHILEARGFSIYYSGPLTPVAKIDQIFNKIKPDRLYISCTSVPDVEEVQSEVNELFRISGEYGTRVYVGGRGFDLLLHHDPVVEKRLYTFEEVHRY